MDDTTLSATVLAMPSSIPTTPTADHLTLSTPHDPPIDPILLAQPSLLPIAMPALPPPVPIAMPTPAPKWVTVLDKRMFVIIEIDTAPY